MSLYATLQTVSGVGLAVLTEAGRSLKEGYQSTMQRSPRRPLPIIRVQLGGSDLNFVEGFSYEDGNIVLRARKREPAPSQGNIQTTPSDAYLHFRVHRSVLQSKSEVFGDMLRIGQASGWSMDTGAEAKDSVAIVEVDDDPNDLASLLQFIYDNHVYLELSNLQKRFEYLSTVLVLADKYQMDGIAKACMVQIRRWSPATLKAWDEAEATAALWKKNLPPGSFLNDHVIEPASVIRLSRIVTDLKDLAPVAFYEISRLSYRCDAALASKPSWQDYLKKGGRLPRRALLNEAEKMTLWRGSNDLKAKIKTLATQPEKYLWTLRVTCANTVPDAGWGQQTCSSKKWWDAWVRNFLLVMFAEEQIDVLSELRTLSAFIKSHRNVEDAIGICDACKNGLSSDVLAMRGVIWNELPALFKEEI